MYREDEELKMFDDETMFHHGFEDDELDKESGDEDLDDDADKLPDDDLADDEEEEMM